MNKLFRLLCLLLAGIYSTSAQQQAVLFTAQPGAIPVTIPAGGGTVTSFTAACGISGGTITTTGTLRRSQTQNAQTGTTDTIADDDCGKLITYSNGSAVAVTLPQANGSTFINGWTVDISNQGAGLVTITPTTSTIDGAATLTIPQYQGVRIVSNGTNYFTVSGRPRGDISVTSVSTGTSPPACTGGTAGRICAGEGTAPTGAADVGILYPNSTATAWMTKLNNGAEDEICQVTLANCGGGSAPYSKAFGTSAVTMTGSDVTVYSFSLPVLAAGSCMALEWVGLGATSSHTLKVFVDATEVATPVTGLTADTLFNYQANFCNNAAVQNAQTVTIKASAYASNPNIGGTWVSYLGQAINTTPTGVDTSTTHTMTFKINGASGTYTSYTGTVKYFE